MVNDDGCTEGPAAHQTGWASSSISCRNISRSFGQANSSASCLTGGMMPMRIESVGIWRFRHENSLM